MVDVSPLVTVVAAGTLGAVAGLGGFVVIAGLTGRVVVPERWSARLGRRVDRAVLRVGLALGGAIVAFLATGWPVLALFAAGFGAWVPSAVEASGRAAAEIARALSTLSQASIGGNTSRSTFLPISRSTCP